MKLGQARVRPKLSSIIGRQSGISALSQVPLPRKPRDPEMDGAGVGAKEVSKV